MDNAIRNEGKRGVASKLLAAISNIQPILAVIEDVHWADAITLSHLATLTKTVAECPALLVITSRIEGDPLDSSWRATTEGSPFFTVDLGPLRKRDSITLISEFMDSADPLVESCLERAAGNPLFLEQLLRAAQEGSDTSLPDSIQSLVLARMAIAVVAGIFFAWLIARTAAQAWAIPGKLTLADALKRGRSCSRIQARVIKPRVPSDPIIRCSIISIGSSKLTRALTL